MFPCHEETPTAGTHFDTASSGTFCTDSYALRIIGAGLCAAIYLFLFI